eukprot:1909625-Alexandrium_andersonii.AAC.1
MILPAAEVGIQPRNSQAVNRCLTPIPRHVHTRLLLPNKPPQQPLSPAIGRVLQHLEDVRELLPGAGPGHSLPLQKGLR